jgi:hypothetical protein
MKFFTIGLITGILIAGIWFWYNPRIVQNTLLETRSYTIYVQGIQSIDTTKKVSSGHVSVQKQPNQDSCVTKIDSVIITPEGGLIALWSEDANRYPLNVNWSFPEVTIIKERVDTVKVFEMQTVEVERQVAWYGSPVAHAVYGALILTLFVIGD